MDSNHVLQLQLENAFLDGDADGIRCAISAGANVEATPVGAEFSRHLNALNDTPLTIIGRVLLTPWLLPFPIHEDTPAKRIQGISTPEWEQIKKLALWRADDTRWTRIPKAYTDQEFANLVELGHLNPAWRPHPNSNNVLDILLNSVNLLDSDLPLDKRTWPFCWTALI